MKKRLTKAEKRNKLENYKTLRFIGTMFAIVLVLSVSVVYAANECAKANNNNYVIAEAE